MARLTKAIKEKILQAAIDKSGVTVRQADLNKKRADFAESIRLHVVGGEEGQKKILKNEEKIRKLIDEMPSSVHASGYYDLCRGYAIPCSFGGMQVHLNYNGLHRDQDHVDRVYKCPAPRSYGNSAALFSAESKETEEFNKMEEEQSAINDLRTQVKLNVNAMLNSVTTDKKLLEIWPESAELIPADIEKPKINLPTTDVQSLNTMIGIPSEKEDA